jgi:hypothetical protein
VAIATPYLEQVRHVNQQFKKIATTKILHFEI